MPTLLIAFDGSPSASAAVQRSAALLPGAEAVVISIAEGVDRLEEAASGARMALPDEVIRTAVRRLREASLDESRELAAAGARLAAEAGLQARAEVVAADGPPWRALLAAARETGADAIACGTRGHGAGIGGLLGSVVSGLVHNADRPVLVVPERPADGTGPVLVAFDGSDSATRAISAAGSLLPGREALALHAWRSQVRHTLTGRALQRTPLRDLREIVGELDLQLEQWARETADRGAELARGHGLQAQARTVESGGPVARAILDAATDARAAAIVVGRRGQGVVATTILGSVSSAILHAADRPVLVVQ